MGAKIAPASTHPSSSSHTAPGSGSGQGSGVPPRRHGPDHPRANEGLICPLRQQGKSQHVQLNPLLSLLMFPMHHRSSSHPCCQLGNSPFILARHSKASWFLLPISAHRTPAQSNADGNRGLPAMYFPLSKELKTSGSAFSPHSHPPFQKS